MFFFGGRETSKLCGNVRVQAGFGPHISVDTNSLSFFSSNKVFLHSLKHVCVRVFLESFFCLIWLALFFKSLRSSHHWTSPSAPAKPPRSFQQARRTRCGSSGPVVANLCSKIINDSSKPYNSRVRNSWVLVL